RRAGRGGGRRGAHLAAGRCAGVRRAARARARRRAAARHAARARPGACRHVHLGAHGREHGGRLPRRDRRGSPGVRAALDARKLFDGGIGTYIRGLWSALAAAEPGSEWIALVDPADAGRVRWPGAVRERPVRAGKYGLAEHIVVPAAARAAAAELLHAPHYTLPLGWGGAAVVSIFDLIHIRFSRFPRPAAAIYARLVAGWAARRADAVIASSQVTRRDVLELLAPPPERVHVVPLGVSAAIRRAAGADVARFRAERGLPAEYVLYVGARKRHKN